MANIRKSLIFLIIFLALFFNIERLDINGQNIIDLQTFVYVLITIAVLNVLISRRHASISMYYAIFFYEVVYVALKLFVFNNRPLLGNIFTYLTVTEMSLIAISIFLAYDMAHSLQDVEGVIEKVTFPNRGQRILPMNSAGEDVKIEFIRSRRHNRPLAVLVVQIDPSEMKANLEKTVKRLQKAMLNRFLSASLAQILSKEARRTDLIIDQTEEDRFILLCPETSADGSVVLAERIQATAMDRLGVKLNCGVAAFPDEAVTFEDLLQKAVSQSSSIHIDTTLSESVQADDNRH